MAMTLVGATAPGAINAFADNSITVSDDDKVKQSNKAEVKQSAENKATSDGLLSLLNTNAAASSQTAGVSQSNTNTDNDVQTVSAPQTDNDVCGILVALAGISC